MTQTLPLSLYFIGVENQFWFTIENRFFMVILITVLVFLVPLWSYFRVLLVLFSFAFEKMNFVLVYALVKN